MGGFVVTCVDGGHQKGSKEAVLMLSMSIFRLQSRKTQSRKNVEDICEELKKEREKIRKSKLVILGGKRASEILFIRNDSEFSETEIYNELIENTKRAEHVRRIIPVKSIFTLTVDNLIQETKKVCEDIGGQQSFRISLSKRLCGHISSEFIIEKVAEMIPRKVDLKTPDIVVVVEIVKSLCAIGAVKPCPGNYNITREPRKQ